MEENNIMNEDDEDFIFDRLNICSCGDTYNQVKFIYDLLTMLDSNDYEIKWDKSRQLIKDNTETVFQLLGHFLAERNLITYGYSVCCPWFYDTQENNDFMQKLSIMLATIEKDESYE